MTRASDGSALLPMLPTRPPAEALRRLLSIRPSTAYTAVIVERPPSTAPTMRAGGAARRR